MLLGAVGAFVSGNGASVMAATTAVVGAATGVVTANPLLSTVAAVTAYELFHTNNPANLGNNVDTKA